MFGALRFLLALMVVYTHLSGGSHIGRHAVFGFYLLSGYLMTLVLNEKYRFQAGPYFLNRALRLLPEYWTIAALTIIALLVIPAAPGFKSAWNFSAAQPMDILGNLLIFPFRFYKTGFSLVPPTWSVSVEMAHYFLLWLIMARRPAFAVTALAAGICFHVWSLAHGMPPSDRYYSVQASLLPFSLGALLYFWRERIAAQIGSYGRTAIALSAAVFAGAWIAVSPYLIGACGVDGPFYASLVAAFLLVAALSRMKSGRLDSILGQLAYPIFLSHWLCGLLVSHYLLNDAGPSERVFWLGMPLAVLLAVFVSRLVRLRIEPLRTTIRPVLVANS